MKPRVYWNIFVVFAVLAIAAVPSLAQQTVTESLGILEEKLNRLRADVEDLQFKQQQMQKDIAKIQEDLQALRRTAGVASASDLQALQSRVDALDATRQKDKQAIIDQLVKELASLKLPRTGEKTGGPESPAPTNSDAKEHVVQKGEYLSVIARKYGVSVADLKKANNLTSDDIKPGQKLVIPK